MDKKVIFVHGYEGYPEKDWFPSIGEALDRLGVDYSVPSMPGDSYPHAKDWVEKLSEEVQKTEKQIVLVGFSLGTRTIFLYLEKFQPKNIDTVILVATSNNDIEEHKMDHNGEYNSFFEHKVNMEKVKSSAKQFIVMHSKDDPWTKYEWGVETAQELGAKLITYEDRGHFYKPENYKYVLEILKKVL